MGPHPTEDRDVFHWFEMCDAVQAESYELDGIAVSNFLFPLYFTGTRETDEVGARNDFLGRSYGGQTLTSFGINPGGYIGFFDPQLGDHDTFTIKGDSIALMRLEMKSRAKEARRSVRYRQFEDREKLREAAEAGYGAKRPARAPRRAMASARKEAVEATGEPLGRLVLSSTRVQPTSPLGSKSGKARSAGKRRKKKAAR